jgi:hypothetical protein
LNWLSSSRNGRKEEKGRNLGYPEDAVLIAAIKVEFSLEGMCILPPLGLTDRRRHQTCLGLALILGEV